MSTTEFAVIARYFSALDRGEAVDLGVGDDCAILRLEPRQRLATSVDTCVAGVHFPTDAAPEDIGFRAVATAASDLAAMGATPLAITVALTLPEVDEAWLGGFSAGLAIAVGQCRLPLIGGDITRGPLTITVQVFGGLPPDRALRRSGARSGDGVYVSGYLGDAAAGLAILEQKLPQDWRPPQQATEYLLRRYYRPEPRLELGQSLLARATAAIDISDGLLADAGHLAKASQVKLRIDPALLPQSAALLTHPSAEQRLRWALTGGDDYELCFCLPAGANAPADCTQIGEVTPGEGVDCGREFAELTGYRHF